MVQEFLSGRHVAVPQTYNMSSLLKELQPGELQQHSPAVVGSAISGLKEKGVLLTKTTISAML